jgi:hypothetical protein
MFKYICSLAIFALIVGCSKITLPQNTQYKLYTMLIAMPDANTQEAQRLSKDIISYSNYLKNIYHPIIEPHFNNFLVNIGVQKQGLCYEWSDALYLHLMQQNYKHYKFHLIVANRGKYWSEHNALSITTPHIPPNQGIIIDLWRDIEGIYINKVSLDTQYQWKHRASRELMAKEVKP